MSSTKSSLAALTLGAIGVVYGDIGTSPLYALKECFSAEHGIPYSTGAVLGILSMIFWALLLVVTVKYVIFVLRADNNGEGGVLSLMALALRSARADKERYYVLLMVGAVFSTRLARPYATAVSAAPAGRRRHPATTHAPVRTTLVPSYRRDLRRGPVAAHGRRCRRRGACRRWR